MSAALQCDDVLPTRGIRNPLSGLFAFELDTNPVYTLQDAIQSIINEANSPTQINVPELLRTMDTAQAKARQVLSDNPHLRQLINLDQASIMTLYTKEMYAGNSMYFEMNRVLKERNRKMVKPFKKVIWLMLTCMKMLPPFEGQSVYRGVKKDVGDNYREGEIVTFYEMTLTSTKIGVMEEFVQTGDGQRGVIFHMELTQRRSRTIEQFSFIKGEIEVLLPLNSTFVVVSKECIRLSEIATEQARANRKAQLFEIKGLREAREEQGECNSLRTELEQTSQRLKFDIEQSQTAVVAVKNEVTNAGVVKEQVEQSMQTSEQQRQMSAVQLSINRDHFKAIGVLKKAFRSSKNMPSFMAEALEVYEMGFSMEAVMDAVKKGFHRDHDEILNYCSNLHKQEQEQQEQQQQQRQQKQQQPQHSHESFISMPSVSSSDSSLLNEAIKSNQIFEMDRNSAMFVHRESYPMADTSGSRHSPHRRGGGGGGGESHIESKSVGSIESSPLVADLNGAIDDGSLHESDRDIALILLKNGYPMNLVVEAIKSAENNKFNVAEKYCQSSTGKDMSVDRDHLKAIGVLKEALCSPKISPSSLPKALEVYEMGFSMEAVIDAVSKGYRDHDEIVDYCSNHEKQQQQQLHSHELLIAMPPSVSSSDTSLIAEVQLLNEAIKCRRIFEMDRNSAMIVYHEGYPMADIIEAMDKGRCYSRYRIQEYCLDIKRRRTDSRSAFQEVRGDFGRLRKPPSFPESPKSAARGKSRDRKSSDGGWVGAGRGVDIGGENGGDKGGRDTLDNVENSAKKAADLELLESSIKELKVSSYDKENVLQTYEMGFPMQLIIDALSSNRVFTVEAAIEYCSTHGNNSARKQRSLANSSMYSSPLDYGVPTSYSRLYRDQFPITSVECISLRTELEQTSQRLKSEKEQNQSLMKEKNENEAAVVALRNELTNAAVGRERAEQSLQLSEQERQLLEMKLSKVQEQGDERILQDKNKCDNHSTGTSLQREPTNSQIKSNNIHMSRNYGSSSSLDLKAGMRIRIDSCLSGSCLFSQRRLWAWPEERRTGCVINHRLVGKYDVCVFLVMDDPLNESPSDSEMTLGARYLGNAADGGARVFLIPLDEMRSISISKDEAFDVQNKFSDVTVLCCYHGCKNRVQQRSDMLLTCMSDFHLVCKTHLLPLDDNGGVNLALVRDLKDALNTYFKDRRQEGDCIATRAVLAYFNWSEAVGLYGRRAVVEDFGKSDHMACQGCGSSALSEPMSFRELHFQIFGDVDPDLPISPILQASSFPNSQASHAKHQQSGESDINYNRGNDQKIEKGQRIVIRSWMEVTSYAVSHGWSCRGIVINSSLKQRRTKYVYLLMDDPINSSPNLLEQEVARKMRMEGEQARMILIPEEEIGRTAFIALDETFVPSDGSSNLTVLCSYLECESRLQRRCDVLLTCVYSHHFVCKSHLLPLDRHGHVDTSLVSQVKNSIIAHFEFVGKKGNCYTIRSLFAYNEWIACKTTKKKKAVIVDYCDYDHYLCPVCDQSESGQIISFQELQCQIFGDFNPDDSNGKEGISNPLPSLNRIASENIKSSTPVRPPPPRLVGTGEDGFRAQAKGSQSSMKAMISSQQKINAGEMETNIEKQMLDKGYPADVIAIAMTRGAVDSQSVEKYCEMIHNRRERYDSKSEGKEDQIHNRRERYDSKSGGKEDHVRRYTVNEPDKGYPCS